MNDEPDIQKASPRTQAHRPVRQSTREPTRESGRGEYKSRTGEVLTRRRTGGADPFHIPPDIIPDGWTYQWNTVSVTGNADVVMDQTMAMHESGWRPVPADRHPGRYVPFGTKGEIVRGGLRLEERPRGMTQDAMREDQRTARQLISDRNDSLKLTGVKEAMPSGFEMNRRYRGTGGDIRMSIDQALDAPSPSHELAEPGE